MTIVMSRMTKKTLSKFTHSVVLGSGRKTTSVKKDLENCNITDLIKVYKKVMLCSILRGNNKLH